MISYGDIGDYHGVRNWTQDRISWVHKNVLNMNADPLLRWRTNADGIVLRSAQDTNATGVVTLPSTGHNVYSDGAVTVQNGSLGDVRVSVHGFSGRNEGPGAVLHNHNSCVCSSRPQWCSFGIHSSKHTVQCVIHHS
mmetsp:Transcript_9991/g.37259  ORF Transcript_9991/g.37259 Transcript_9991/m.37259 type:complete len:137 (+) Transcript_9991:5664-6074(+)